MVLLDRGSHGVKVAGSLGTPGGRTTPNVYVSGVLCWCVVACRFIPLCFFLVCFGVGLLEGRRVVND